MEYKPHPSKALEATYPGAYPAKIRRFLPYLLGTRMNGNVAEEVVLAYQYYLDPDFLLFNPKNWRCFKVEALVGLSVIGLQHPPTIAVPPPLKFKQVKKQNCVDEIEEWRQKRIYSM